MKNTGMMNNVKKPGMSTLKSIQKHKKSYVSPYSVHVVKK